MFKTSYTSVKTKHLAEVGLVGADGKEVLTCLVYDNVMPAARFSHQDCTLKTLIDGLEKCEICVMTPCIYVVYIISDAFVLQTLLASLRLLPPRPLA